MDGLCFLKFLPFYCVFSLNRCFFTYFIIFSRPRIFPFFMFFWFFNFRLSLDIFTIVLFFLSCRKLFFCFLSYIYVSYHTFLILRPSCPIHSLSNFVTHFLFVILFFFYFWLLFQQKFVGLQNLLKTCSRHVLKCSRHVLKTSSTHVLKTSSARLQCNNFSSFKTSWRRFANRS